MTRSVKLRQEVHHNRRADIVKCMTKPVYKLILLQLGKALLEVTDCLYSSVLCTVFLLILVCLCSLTRSFWSSQAKSQRVGHIPTMSL